jgi:hypothetical protein
MPPRAWVIAVATAMQESRLTNLGDLGARNDHDSLGLFQQRPSAGWGTPAQIRTRSTRAPSSTRSSRRSRLGDDVAHRGGATVQISAYPDAYAKHEPLATQIVNASPTAPRTRSATR